MPLNNYARDRGRPAVGGPWGPTMDGFLGVRRACATRGALTVHPHRRQGRVGRMLILLLRLSVPFFSPYFAAQGGIRPPKSKANSGCSSFSPPARQRRPVKGASDLKSANRVSSSRSGRRRRRDNALSANSRHLRAHPHEPRPTRPAGTCDGRLRLRVTTAARRARAPAEPRASLIVQPVCNRAQCYEATEGTGRRPQERTGPLA